MATVKTERKQDEFPEIEHILSSKGRVRIIKLLAEYGELNISKISKLTGLNHNSVSYHLNFLTEIGFLQEKTFGRIKIYRYCDENLKAKALQNLIKFWKS